MLPWQTALGWNVGVISSSAAIGIFLYGLAGPFAAAVMQRFGIRRTVLGALTLMSASTGCRAQNMVGRYLDLAATNCNHLGRGGGSW